MVSQLKKFSTNIHAMSMSQPSTGRDPALGTLAMFPRMKRVDNFNRVHKVLLKSLRSNQASGSCAKDFLIPHLFPGPTWAGGLFNWRRPPASQPPSFRRTLSTFLSSAANSCSKDELIFFQIVIRHRESYAQELRLVLELVGRRRDDLRRPGRLGFGSREHDDDVTDGVAAARCQDGGGHPRQRLQGSYFAKIQLNKVVVVVAQVVAFRTIVPKTQV